MWATVLSYTGAGRVEPACTEGVAADRLLTALNAMQAQAPVRWAMVGESGYAQLLRWCCQQRELSAVAAGESSSGAARLGTCCYELGLFPEWEDCQKHRGLMPARDIEKALRWDQRASSCAGRGYALVTQYLSQHPQGLGGLMLWQWYSKR
jgi:hypothetical protein